MSMSKTKEVYVLYETYKDCDREAIGCYDSMRAMIRGFSERLAGAVSIDHAEGGKKPAMEIAHALAEAIPALLGEPWAADECKYGRSVFGFDVHKVESIDEGGDEDDEEESDG